MLGNETVFLLVLFHLLSKTEMKIIRWLGATTNPSRGSPPQISRRTPKKNKLNMLGNETVFLLVLFPGTLEQDKKVKKTQKGKNQINPY